MPSRKKQQVESDDDDMDDHEDGPDIDVKNELRRLIDPDYAEKFVASLDAVVQGRVRALQGMQTTMNDLHNKYMEEHKALEKKYETLYGPIFVKRAEILSGQREPTQEEVTKGQGEDFKEPEDANQEVSDAKGVPDFWLTALKNHDAVCEIIEERDEECLKSLVNITAKTFDDPDTGFVLEFHFAENPFFTNTVLTKTYHLVDEDEIVMDKAEGCEINWKPGQNLTVAIKKKKVKGRGKGTKQITKEEPCESFFNFFKPPQLPDDMDEEDEDDELGDTLEELIEQDYEIGCAIKDQVVAKAVSWYTGEAADHDDDDDDDDEDGDEDDDDDDDEDDEPPPRRGGRKPKEAPKKANPNAQPECKQQ
eukprot:EG_transcript_11747